ncbi:TetR/AcrR family transcriptional regulator [Paenibacillus sp. GYB004]|uniref:TetR/AcrR family transcriptional regulator n=1 Tax=Paenibacillus sp. GYB004 TaxID=2994393 RepID=UPI002F96B821
MLRETRKKALKEQIFVQALQLFQEKGFEQVTVQEIASACGIAKGTFFNYFTKKEEILLYLGESQLEVLNRGMEEYQDVPEPKEQLKLVLTDLLQRYTSNGELMKLSIVEVIKSAYLFENESKSIRRLQQSLASLIDRARRNGELNSRWDTDVIVSTVLGVYLQTMMSWSLPHNQHTRIGDMFERYLDVIWEGIAQR